MDVYEFALQMELDGKAFYIKQAAATQDPGLHTIFSRLADDEQKHYDTIKSIQSGEGPTSISRSTVLDEAKNVFVQLMETGKADSIGSHDLDAYRAAMKIEKDSYRLYHDAAEREQKRTVRKLLMQIAGEEQNHYEILENIYHFVNAPNQFLSWGEFSNLDEFHNFGRNVDLRKDE